MPTPSELLQNAPRRSIYGNYSPDDRETGLPSSPVSSAQTSATRTPATLQAAIDTAIACAFLHRFIARSLEPPDVQGWNWMCSPETQASLRAVFQALPAEGQFASAASGLFAWLEPDGYEVFESNYVTAFGHTVRGDCPMNEIEYGDIKADPLFQPHRLADLGAFYSAFGLEVGADAAERIDHISIELEFMSVLAAKEAYALEHQLDDEQHLVLLDAQKKFLREHLGRWSPAFSRRLAKMAGATALGALARLLGEFLKLECACFNISPGSEDLLLRPVDEASESLCASCGITGLPPGALQTGPQT